jgi:TM2 domain-containing membrane protein YozV
MNAGQMLLLKELSDSDRKAFHQAYAEREKRVSTAVCLAVGLGLFGAHHFYVKNPKKGLLYLSFSWTLVPGFLGLIDALKIGSTIRQHNCSVASEIVREMKIPSRKPQKLAA